MSEQELIQALQGLIARHSRPADPQRVGWELVGRDRVRIQLLASVTALLWLGSIAAILYMIYRFNQFIIAYTPATGGPDLNWPAGYEFRAKMELHHSLEACLAAVPALLLAALGTVWLVLSSRRATLNQINQSLAEISRQLRELRPPAPSRDTG